MADLCKHCDVFIGFGGSGVARRPDAKALQEHSLSEVDLGNICWICLRTREQIEEAGQLVQVER